MAIEITRQELTAAAKTKDSRAARRMLAIALVLEGADRTSTTTACGMDRLTVPNRSAKTDAAWIAARTFGVVTALAARHYSRTTAEQWRDGEAGSTSPHPAPNVPQNRSCHEKADR